MLDDLSPWKITPSVYKFEDRRLNSNTFEGLPIIGTGARCLYSRSFGHFIVGSVPPQLTRDLNDNLEREEYV